MRMCRVSRNTRYRLISQNPLLFFGQFFDPDIDEALKTPGREVRQSCILP
jgi:hypothetical protein